MRSTSEFGRRLCIKGTAIRLRRALTTTVLLLLLLLTLPAVVEAQLDYTNNYGIWTYTPNNGNCTITGYSGPGGDVTIPGTINDMPVTSVGTNAFAGVSSLINVTIPNSVSSIRWGAFSQCFSLGTVTIGSGVTIIEPEVFDECTNLASVTIPNSVTSIGDDAFCSCTSITSVTIPNSVTSIGAWAFEICSSLTNLTIPKSVISIGEGAFSDCGSLTWITIDDLDLVYSTLDGVLFDKNQTTVIQCPGGKAGSYTIPGGVTNIGDSAFFGCISLGSVTIPDSVINIGKLAFFGCSSLTNITIPNGVIGIGEADFNGCSSLASVTIGSKVNSIGDAAFYGCGRLASVYFQGNSPNLGSLVFVYYYPDWSGTELWDPGTIYYLPGTTAWGRTFGGLPTRLWNAQVQPGSFAVRSNQFGFNITGTSNLVIVIEATTSLANPTWSSIQTNTLNGNPLYFTDPQWTNYPRRFYRVTWP